MIEYGEGEAVDGCYAYHNDHLSTPRAMTDDAGTGLYYNWHRYYVPGLGVYTRLDPVGTLVPSRLSLGSADYSRADPVYSVDPQGLWPYKDWGDAEYWRRRQETSRAMGEGVGTAVDENPFSINEDVRDEAWWTDKKVHCVASCRMAVAGGAGVAYFFGWVQEDGVEAWGALTGEPHPADLLDICANEKGIDAGQTATGPPDCERMCDAAVGSVEASQ
jgi:RHS repeat-associated protein